MRHHPLGSAVSITEVPTECLAGSIGHRLKSLSARMTFRPLEPLSPLPPILRMGGGKAEASTRCCKELSAYCAMAVPRMFLSRWYTSRTPSMEGAGNVPRSAAALAMFWLALEKVGSCRSARPISTVRPSSSADSRWCKLAGLGSIAVHSSASSPCCRVASHLMLFCRTCCRSSW
jgi:hypothetical protein